MPGDPCLVTGAAGFIGAAVCGSLLNTGQPVVGVDNMNAYYDPALKQARIRQLETDPSFLFCRLDLTDQAAVEQLFGEHRPPTVIHLAAQPGIDRSLTDPMAYVQSNLVGTMNVMEQSRINGVAHLVYASSSSVYGANSRLPFSVHDPADHPVNLYAATKRANELMAHSYSHLFGLPTTGLRFFTVYGPWGRPDMAYYRFARAMTGGEPINIYGDGTQGRDFTFISDIVDGVVKVSRQPPSPNAAWNPAESDPASSRAPFRLYNIGQGDLVTVNELADHLEAFLGVKADRRYQPARPADMTVTQADVTDLRDDTGCCPRTKFDVGIKTFAQWFLDYHR